MRPRETLKIGLLNNISDAGLAATQRQFTDLLHRATNRLPLEWQYYSLPDIARARPLPREYRALAELRSDPPDALIVSGAEPIEAELTRETYWASLTGVLDWAADARMPLMLSCLAAHAAVLHWHGVPRRRLARKCSGVFRQSACAAHPITQTAMGTLHTPQSRWHDLPEAALAEAGYQTITASPEAGVDIFIHPSRPSVLFFNGHPEYDPLALAREYRRDVGRYLAGETAGYPDPPAHFFDAETERRLIAFRAQPESRRHAAFPAIDAAPAAIWYPLADAAVRSWLAPLLEADMPPISARALMPETTP